MKFVRAGVASLWVIGAWTTYHAGQYPLDGSAAFGFIVVLLFGLVAGFFFVKIRCAVPADIRWSPLLLLFFGKNYGLDASALFGAYAFALFAIGRTAHAIWDRSTIELVEFVSFAVAVGIFCGAKLAVRDMSARPQL